MNEYKLISDVSVLALTTTEVNEHLRLSIADVSTDTHLSLLIKAVRAYGEKFTKLDFMTKTWETYRENFEYFFLLERAPIQSITSVKYTDINGATQTISNSFYYLLYSSFFKKLVFKNTFVAPDLIEQYQPIQIQFKSGFGDTNTSIPSDIKLAMLAHLAAIYEHRGDDDSQETGDILSVDALCPIEAKLIYSKYAIKEI